ncbi:MAG: copper-binding protein [Candidatus Moduliflexus flocculans]|nr:copper-binding protein [Candidatus Moduliflexus flocculans]
MEAHETRHPLILIAARRRAVPPRCSAPPPPENVRQFPLTGEVLAVKPDRSEVQVKHDEVKGFMEPMTMWFNIKDPALLDGLAPGRPDQRHARPDGRGLAT